MNRHAHAYYKELNLDRLAGPSHNFGGLSGDNRASVEHKGQKSNPKAAALEGLEKMYMLHKRGIPQGILPPQRVPRLDFLAQLGFTTPSTEALSQAYRQAPTIFQAAWASASMWMANAGTFTPAIDGTDGQAHFTPANLNTHVHRALEASNTYKEIREYFRNLAGIAIHPPLPSTAALADEGAANHTRLAPTHSTPNGLHVFIYGKNQHGAGRQSLEASRAIARIHGIPESQCIYIAQNPEAIKAGVFHNDVISTGNESLFIVHDAAFMDQKSALNQLQERFLSHFKQPLTVLPIATADISLKDAVDSYLFNSQLISLQDGNMLLVAPTACSQMPNVHQWIEKTIHSKNNPINEVVYVNLGQSMAGGGGPACLRLRILLAEKALCDLPYGTLLTEALYEELSITIQKHYLDSLVSEQLLDRAVIQGIEDAQAAIWKCFHLHQKKI